MSGEWERLAKGRDAHASYRNNLMGPWQIYCSFVLAYTKAVAEAYKPAPSVYDQWKAAQHAKESAAAALARICREHSAAATSEGEQRR